MEPGVTDLWEQILERARAALPEQSFSTWLTSASPVSLADGVLHIDAPSRFHAEWLEDKYGAMVNDIAASIMGYPVSLRFTSAETAPARTPRTSPSRPSSRCRRRPHRHSLPRVPKREGSALPG